MNDIGNSVTVRIHSTRVDASYVVVVALLSCCGCIVVFIKALWSMEQFVRDGDGASLRVVVTIAFVTLCSIFLFCSASVVVHEGCRLIRPVGMSLTATRKHLSLRDRRDGADKNIPYEDVIDFGVYKSWRNDVVILKLFVRGGITGAVVRQARGVIPCKVIRLEICNTPEAEELFAVLHRNCHSDRSHS